MPWLVSSLSQNQTLTQAEKLESEHRLEEAKMGLERSRQEVLFWEERIRVLLGLAEEGQPLEGKLQDAIGAARWTEKGENFAWAFVRDQQGAERSEVRALVEAIESDPKHQLAIAGFRYSISKDGKFLQRNKVK
jgi:hypothetical protein